MIRQLSRRPSYQSAPAPAPVAPTTLTPQQIRSDSIFVSNLATDIGEEELRNEIFTDCGVVDNVVINYDRQGRSQGTATVTFSSFGSAQKACQEFDGAQVDGRVMRVKLVGALAPVKVVVKRAASPAPQAAPRQERQEPRYEDRRDSPRGPAPRRDAPREYRPEPRRDSRDNRPAPRDNRSAPRDNRDNRDSRDNRSAPRDNKRGPAPSSPRRSAPSSPTRGGAPVKQQRAESRKPQQQQRQGDNKSRQQKPKPAPKPKAKPVTAADLDAQMDRYNAQREAAKAGQP